MKKYRTLLLRFTLDNKRAQKSLLGGMECVVQLHSDALLPKVSAILKVCSLKNYQITLIYVVGVFTKVNLLSIHKSYHIFKPNGHIQDSKISILYNIWLQRLRLDHRM